MARHWSGVSSKDERAFKLALPGGIGREGVAGLGFAHGLDGQQFAATSRTARSACALAFAQRVPPSVFSGGCALPAPTYLPTRCASVTGT